MIQNYVDHDPGPDAKDYQCGFLTYDGHKGTDIRLVDIEAMNRGVTVVAAAEGRVRAIRDGMADTSVRDTGKDAVKGREAGNSVVIDHGNGWETQYGHLRKGSVMVKPGSTVRRGQALGLVGLSGLTEFPHLHFEVRLKGTPVDPFTGSGDVACGVNGATLWAQEVLATLKYTPTGVINAGFAAKALSLADVMDGKIDSPVGEANAIAFWVHIYGARSGDVELLRIITPTGQTLVETRSQLPGNKADWLSLVGKKRDPSASSWPPGVYRGEYTLQRRENDKFQQALAFTRELTIPQY